MAYFLRTDENGQTMGVWEITDTEAVRVGITNPRGGAGTSFCADPGENIFDAIQRQATGWLGSNGENLFHKINRAPGDYYPRMARPHDLNPLESPGINPAMQDEQETILKIRSHITLLARHLSDIFQTVHPVAENMWVYGNGIRNLLLLASMEVEAQCKGILRANGVMGERTKDYVKLLPAMKLDAYSISLTEFPWLEPIAPFAAWNPSVPTQSLDWYNAYNATKHDRENAYAEATLERAIAAVCANVILLAAQYGIAYGLGERNRLIDEFDIVCVPRWAPSDVYINPYDISTGWMAKKFPF